MGATARNILRELAIWGAVALGGFSLLYFYNDLRGALGLGTDGASPSAMVARDVKQSGSPTGFGGEVRLTADASGHFVFDAAINDRPVTLMADTGATVVVLTYEDAAKVGLSPQSLDFSARVQTANGVSRVAPVTLDRLRVGDITLRDVPAAVADRGALATNLLGMSFLGRLTRFELFGRELILVQ